MTHDLSSEAVPRPASSLLRFRIWHLWLVALFVAIAILNIREQRRSEPALIALASAGFAVYGLLAWGSWCLARRLRPRLGAVTVLVLYLVAMAILFLVATLVYLVLENGYLIGWSGVSWLPPRAWSY